MSTTLSVTILHPDRQIYKGSAVAVSSVNEQGFFDILPMHTNFISIVREYVHVWENKEEKKEFKIEKGIVKAVENTIYIFVGM